MLYPCPNCGKLAMPGQTCPHCGFDQFTVGDAIVQWLSDLTPEARTAAIAAEPVEHWPASLMRVYPGRNPAETQPRFEWESRLLGEAGYQVTSQTYGGGGATIGDFALFGVFAGLKKDTSGLYVNYTRAPA